MTYSEFFEKHKDAPELHTRWDIPICNQPVLVFWTLGYDMLDKIHQRMADDWPGTVLYMPNSEGVNARFLPEYIRGLDEQPEQDAAHVVREAAPGFRHKIPTVQRSILDAEHWEGTPEHVRYTLGRQMDHIAELSEDIVHPDELSELSGKMCDAARIIAALFCLGMVDDDD